jgi:predicted branched-subunit amino acid permease
MLKETAMRSAILDGLGAAAPATLFIVPFGMYSGVVAAEAGLSMGAMLAMSIIVFAGASQIAALELFSGGAPWFVIALSGIAVNLRFLMYAAALAPWFRDAPLRIRLMIAYVNVDNGIGSLMGWQRLQSASTAERVAFFLALGCASWSLWQIGVIIGFLFGAQALSQDLLRSVAPVAFVAMVAPLLTSPPRWVAAIMATVLSILLVDLPFQLGVIVAAAIGVAIAACMPVNEDAFVAQAGIDK